ncbi:hypothetical protein N7495_004794 [Penicillium taxi]|uniref:uncharacterized protein n=1 Tax=Penicillium taxi TaxID=168475 RepID=UPI002544E513|nr:uncharacterized protein N7495_004794 [Penicillium taxi]KAJ5900050.1 hypothetical protein N7495_004794 [Penicillium taxi]
MNDTHNLRIEKGNQDTYLVGECLDPRSHHWETSTLRLDDCLGDERAGKFKWGGREFTRDATNVSFKIEGVSNVPILRADLRDDSWHYLKGDVNLAERIENRDGHLRFS